MPCGRLLFSSGDKRAKLTRRKLHWFNIPRHIQGCWKCQAVESWPRLRLAVRFRAVIDSKTNMAVGMVKDVIDRSPQTNGK